MPEWTTFRCKIPRGAYLVLEDALEKAKLLAEIDDDLSVEISDGLALEYLAIEFLNVPEESVI